MFPLIFQILFDINCFYIDNFATNIKPQADSCRFHRSLTQSVIPVVIVLFGGVMNSFAASIRIALFVCSESDTFLMNYTSTPNNKFIRRQCIRNLLFGVLVCGIVGFPYMNRAVYSDGYGMK